jgi:hypothetical protein
MTDYRKFQRDEWNALVFEPDWCKELMAEAHKEGAWQTGIASDRKGRGSAINQALYGYEEEQGLCVVQVRQATFHPKHYTRVRKDYYLIGHSEDGSFFAHPVGTPSRSKVALASPEDTVSYVLSKIWDCHKDDLADIERQGDVAFVPIRKLPFYALKVEGPVIIRDSHVLTGDIWRENGLYYVRRGARLKHVKGQHAPVRAKGGLYRVQPGIRNKNWGFTAPQGD